MSETGLPEHVREALSDGLLEVVGPSEAVMEYEEQYLQVEFEARACLTCGETVGHQITTDTYRGVETWECSACHDTREVVNDGGRVERDAGVRERIGSAVKTAKETGHELPCMSRLRADGEPLIPYLRQADGTLCEFKPKYAVGGEEGHIHLVCGHHDHLARKRVYQVEDGKYPDYDPGTGVIETVPLRSLHTDSDPDLRTDGGAALEDDLVHLVDGFAMRCRRLGVDSGRLGREMEYVADRLLADGYGWLEEADR